MLIGVDLPVAPSRTGAACVEVAQRAGDYALCGALVQITLAPDGREADDVRVALLGVGQRPERASAVEDALRGKEPTAGLLREAAALAADQLTPLDDRQASPQFRKHLARVLVRRGLEQALARAA